jgi:ATP-dependent RNA helicase RhlE
MTIQPEQCQTNGFYGLNIAPKLLDALLKLGFKAPTPIQRKAIPSAIDGKDIIGVAQTGTGKTLAFGLPMIQRIARTGGRGLVVLPTRELAIQVDETFGKVGRQFGLRTAVVIGGTSIVPQKRALAADPHVIIGTPGRIIDHLEQRTIDLSKVSVLVLDEADRMLDMGFMPQIKRILLAVPKVRQTMLFSATMPEDIVRIASSHMQMPVRVEIARPGTTAERVEHELFVVKKEQKNRLLEKLLGDYHGSVLVFSRTKHGAHRITRAVKAMGHGAAEIHSDRSLAQRRDALEGFKSGKYRVLVATDIAARGIDVSGIELVLNYDVPVNPEDYVHRIGRTGRAGMAGRAISFAMPDQGDIVRGIERLTSIHLPVSRLPELPPDRAPVRPLGIQRDFGARRGGFSGGSRGGSKFGGTRERRPAGRSGSSPSASGYYFSERRFSDGGGPQSASNRRRPGGRGPSRRR